MGRGYWLPPSYENLPAYDGFYIDSSAVYTDDPDQDWENLLHKICVKMAYHEKKLRTVCDWRTCSAGQSRFVVLQNRHVDIIAEDDDGYIAVYVIIPENCECPGFAKRSFPQYVSLLKSVLTDIYPGSIRKRVNSQHIKTVG